MAWISHTIDFLLHLDRHLHAIVQEYGAWTYLILFIIIFCETGLVFTPFLPGDSLLFVAGALTAIGSLSIGLILIVLTFAAILGDTVNYWMGNILAKKIFRHERIPFLKQKYLVQTQKFYEKYGGKTIIIARFVPIIRTFAPFLAGAGKMSYARFLSYNVIGAVLWILLFTLGGYFFGNLPIVKRNFTVFIFIIIILSCVPAVLEYWKHKESAA